MIQPVREAALRGAAVQFYPFLPARMWTSAAHLTELVARYRGVGGGTADRANRILPDAHFRFRGGGGRKNGERPDPRLGRRVAPALAPTPRSTAVLPPAPEKSDGTDTGGA
jgi:hypothetical protein